MDIKKNNQLTQPSSSSNKAPTPKVEEEIYNIKEDSALIQYEMNMIELPFFTRDKNIGEGVGKKYIFSQNQYMEVIPSSNKDSGYKIPQKFDEKIFYSIMQLYRKQGKRKIVTTMYELLKLAGYGDNRKEYKRATESIDRLRGTEYIFSGILYDKKQKQRISARVNKGILQSAGIKKIEDLDEEEKVIFGRESSKKTVVVIEISDFIEENIAVKGFLYYDADKLLEVKNSTARKLYLLISKWHGWEKKETVRRSCSFLASRIPLSWENTNIPGTINGLEKAAEDLKKRGLIGNYTLERYKPLSESFMSFTFEGADNSAKAKAIRKENEKLSTRTGQEDSVIRTIENKASINSKEAIQETLFEVNKPEVFIESEEEKIKEKKLTAKAEEVIREMNEDRLKDLKASAYKHVRYTVDRHQVIEGVKTEEELINEIMIMIIRNEFIE